MNKYHRKHPVFSGLVVLLLGLLVGQTLFAKSVDDVPNPRQINAWVSDTAGLISAERELSINRKLNTLEQNTGIEVAVVTVESVNTPTPKEFATTLFNRWNIGKSSTNNGLLILLVRGENRLEMETGYGLESTLSDGWLKRMQMRAMVPAFKRGNYGEGLESGVDAVVGRLGNKSGQLALEGGAQPATPDSNDGVPWWIWALGLGGAGVFSGIGIKRYKYKKDRTCPECQKPMEMVPEEDDDVYYDAGQVAEEKLGSVDYQYYFCTDCDFHRILTVKNFISAYDKCHQCGYRTVKTTTRMIRYASARSTGLKEVSAKCTNCRFSHTRRVTVASISTGSSSSTSGYSGGGGFSGGGGGSFGGGSSGGGGAGSSW